MADVNKAPRFPRGRWSEGKGNGGGRKANRERERERRWRVCAFSEREVRGKEEYSAKLLRGTYLANEA